MNDQDDSSIVRDNNVLVSNSNRLAVGPTGNNILCDSPQPPHLPYYAGPDQSTKAREQQTPAVCPPSPPSSKQQEKKINSTTATTGGVVVNSTVGSGNNNNSRRMKPRRVIGNYTLVSTLGSGSMGKVRLAVHNLNQDKLAVKIVPRVGTQDHLPQDEDSAKKKREKDQQREIRTIREASIMLLLHHPYIVSLKEMVVLDPYYYMFMEYVDGGQLLDFIISHGKLKERHARRFARQIVSALDYCHRNSIVHRDLKIENILISRDGNIKIIDFGLSNLFSPRSHLSTFCGSLYFAAPELLNAKAYTGPEVDVWSFGIVLYVLVCGKVPFDDQNMAVLHDKIKRGVVDYPNHLSSDCKSILSRMLVVNPSHRASTAEITIHPWMNKGYNEQVDNHLPERTPLSLPVDMEVVRGMTGFEFGSEDEIKQQLESIIQSDEYQKAASALAERQLQQQSQRSQVSSHSPLSRRHQSFTLPNDDPQSIPAAYHPLVSIYYLVKERLERAQQTSPDHPHPHPHSISSRVTSNLQRSFSPISSSHPFDSAFPPSPTPPLPASQVMSTLISDTFDTQPTQQQQQYRHRHSPPPVSAQPVPIISIPEAAHATSQPSHQQDSLLYDNVGRLHTSSLATAVAGVAYGEKGKTNFHVDDDGHITDLDKHLMDSHHGFSRLFNRHATSSHRAQRHQRDTVNSIPVEHHDTEHAGSNNLNHALQQLTQVMTRNSIDHKNDHRLEQRAHTQRQRRHTNDERTPTATFADILPFVSASTGQGPAHVTGTNRDAITENDGTRYQQQEKREQTKQHQKQHCGVPLTVNTKIQYGDGRYSQQDGLDGSSLSAGTKRIGRTFSKMLSRKNGGNSDQEGGNSNNGAVDLSFALTEIPDVSHEPYCQYQPIKDGARSNSRNRNVDNTIIEDSCLQRKQQHLHEQSYPTGVGGGLHQQQGTADEEVRPVFLKGLFSVSTTSTKHPSVIRADLIRVLERIGVKWRESKSRFECVHVPSIDLNRVTITNQGEKDQDDLQHHDLSQQQPMHGHESSVSLSPPPSTVAAGTANAASAPVTVPDLVVRFEIYIVKVPWLLGMHGLQFRRVSGNVWQYKNMCGRILAELKL